MKIKRRWKVMMILPMVWCIIALAIGPGIYAHGIESYTTILWLLGGWFLGTVTGVLIYDGAIDAENREIADNKFKDDVFIMYEDCLIHKISEEDSVNKTANFYDTSPSTVRNIIRKYI